jgi:hypothetical protein
MRKSNKILKKIREFCFRKISVFAKTFAVIFCLPNFFREMNMDRYIDGDKDMDMDIDTGGHGYGHGHGQLRGNVQPSYLTLQYKDQ